MKNRLGQKVDFPVDQEKIHQLNSFKTEQGEAFPKLGILVLTYNTENQIQSTLSRIPEQLHDLVEEIFLFDNCSQDNTLEKVSSFLEGSIWKDKVKVFQNPKNMGYGGNQKAGYNYALKRGIDYTVMLHGDGQYAPEYLPDMFLPIFTDKKHVVYGSRMLNKRRALEGGMPLYKWIGNTVLTTFENIILGTRMTEFHSGYRMYGSDILRKIPFNENTNDWHFDTQIIIQ
ncbi:MAG: hypothetical protein CL677_10575, partial [Bdellovibrionaceae bacterium]|nr:hypothetical protein [Pseudobdellovibrionaceae bacterium]